MIEALIGFAGVIVGSAIAVFKEAFTSWMKKRRDADYAAVRLVAGLEEYAEKCIDVVFDDGTSCGQPAGVTEHGELFHKPQAEKPAPLSFPPDIDWKSLNRSLMFRILSLPSEARSTDRYIAATMEHAGPPDYDELFEARQEGYAALALEALQLGEALRQKHRLPEKDHTRWNADWDPVREIETRVAKIKADRERRNRHAAALFKDNERIVAQGKAR